MDQGTSESQTERHGGQGKKRPPFELEQEARTSEVFGQGKSNGESHSISVSPPKDREGEPLNQSRFTSDTFLNGIMFVWSPVPKT
ncbi:hypothetical protein FRC11_003052 [Ceratobasidium sp. 423]|nr:hypothetical protein FRC11_003052 [Ceratobasidium sp. 423]